MQKENLTEDKNSFSEKTVLLTRNYAALVVTLFFNPTHVTYVILHHKVVTT